MTKLKVPEGINCVSAEGITYEVKDGIVEVPSDAAPALISFGCEYLPDEPVPAEAVPTPTGKLVTDPETEVTTQVVPEETPVEPAPAVEPVEHAPAEVVEEAPAEEVAEESEPVEEPQV